MRMVEAAPLGRVMPMLLSREPAILCFALAIACAAGPARLSAQPDVPLLGSYCGDYRWHGTSVVNAIRLDFRHRTLRPDSRLDVDGAGWATNPLNGVRTRFSVRAVVDPGSGHLSMTESVGSDVTDWVTDGSYEGRVEPDGSAIVATWTSSKPPYDSGVLRLRRCGPSDPAV
jgi:hypothetical protein